MIHKTIPFAVALQTVVCCIMFAFINLGLHLLQVEFIGHSFRTHTRAHYLHYIVRTKTQAMRSEKLCVDLHEQIVVRHRLGQGYKTISNNSQ